MVDYTADNLLIRCIDDDKPGLVVKIPKEQVGWDYLNAVVMRIEKQKKLELTTDQYEYVAIILNGVCDISTDKGNFAGVGYRKDVFSGLPHAIYMPPKTDFAIEAKTDDLEVVMCWAVTDKEHPIKLITPDDVKIELKGSGNASYQVNTIIATDFAAHRLLIQEIYIPGGNWGLYPPIKHDTHRTTPKGDLLEAYLEKVCLYKFNRSGGYAIQRIYTEDGSLNATVIPNHNDAVIVPKGYHAIASAPGYGCYVLAIMAGSAHEYRTSTDPEDVWLLDIPGQHDPRLPLVDRGMNPRSL